MPQDITHSSYKYCLNIVKNHYENFPVASILLPSRLRKPISAIYAFARTADDIVDEGSANKNERLDQLDEMAQKLDMLRYGKSIDDPIFIALSDTIEKFDLPISLFHDLLSAFKMDTTVHRYENFEQLLTYCKYSANPIGQLLLYLCHSISVDNIKYSNLICTALQLINFLQDIEQDYQQQNRIYLPLDEMQQYDITEEHIKNKTTTDNFKLLINSQITRVQSMLDEGRPLGKVLPGRMGFEIKLTIISANRIIQKLLSNQENLFCRPRLKWQDSFWILNQVLFKF